MKSQPRYRLPPAFVVATRRRTERVLDESTALLVDTSLRGRNPPSDRGATVMERVLDGSTALLVDTSLRGRNKPSNGGATVMERVLDVTVGPPY